MIKMMIASTWEGLTRWLFSLLLDYVFFLDIVPFQVIRGLIITTMAGKPTLCRIGRHVRFGRIRTVRIGYKTYIREHAVIKNHVTIGDRVYIGNHTQIGSRVTIENDVTISQYVKVMTSTHQIGGPEKRSADVVFVGPTRVGRGAWIGADVIILPQVSEVGPGSIVAAGAVVTKDVAPDHVMGGNPAKTIKVLS